MPLFLGKLQEKKQSVQRQNQAKFAIELLYEMNASTQNKQKTAPVNNHSYQVKDNIKRDYNDPVIKAENKPIHKVSTDNSTPLLVTPQLGCLKLN